MDTGNWTVFCYSCKVFRLKAKLLLDAAGALLSQKCTETVSCHLIGPGPKWCLLDDAARQLFCLYVKLILPSIFNSVRFRDSMYCLVIEVRRAVGSNFRKLIVFIDDNVQGY